MSAFSMKAADLEPILSQFPGYPLVEVTRIGGGKNSQVYRVKTQNSQQYALKLYFRHSLDKRNRLGTEFSALQLFRESGIKCVPQPVFANAEEGWAIYEYIEGSKIASSDVKAEDIKALVQFLSDLNHLKLKSSCQRISPASEACFSVRAIVNNLEKRLNRLASIEDRSGQYQDLDRFLKKNWIPCFQELICWCNTRLAQSNLSFEKELSFSEKTLSPSDFGFHNALRQTDGTISFLDFEYFGWDDPAKMISDFLLHPARVLEWNLKQQFFETILASFDNYPNLTQRVEIVYPLFGLKWCLIFLNEFVPEHFLRRGFAEVSPVDKSQRQAEQLEKSQQMLHKIASEYEQFPYHS